MGRVITGSRGSWNAGRTTVMNAGPIFNFTTDASVVDTVLPNRYVGIGADEQLATALPQYKHYSIPHSFPDVPWSAPTRPLVDGTIFQTSSGDTYGWEPSLYWGKPNTIITKPKACLILYQPNTDVYFNFVLQDLIDAITATVAPTANALGVHMYLSFDTNLDGSYLTRGLLLGGSTGNPDRSSTAALPVRYPFGDLLIISLANDPSGFGSPSVAPAYITTPSAEFPEVGVYVGGLNTASTSTPNTDPTSYFSYVLDSSAELPDMLADDQDLMAEYESNFDFRHVMHPLGGVPLFYLIDPSTTPVVYTATAPGTFPPTISDYFTSMVGSLNSYQLGSTVDIADIPNSYAAAILADIEDYFG